MRDHPFPLSACLIVEDQAETRAWLQQAAAAAFPGARIIAADSLRSARQALAEAGFEPGLVLVDVGLPDGSGVELVRWLADHRPEALAVVVTIYDDDLHLFDAIAAGAQGYVLKSEASEVLTARLARILDGEPPLSPSIARRMLQRLRPQGPAKPDASGLTGRETEVLTLLARGHTVAEAAQALGLSPQTVASYVKTIYQKLNVSNRAEAVMAAAARGLT